MVTFPAFCSSCGLIFDSRAIAIEGAATNITISGVRETCPRCGAWADLPDGTFNVVSDTIHVLASPEITRQRLQRLAEIIEAAQRGDLTEEQTAEAVADTAPSVAPWFEQMQAKMGKAFLAFLLQVLLLLAGQLVTEARDDSATREDVERAIGQAIERCTATPPESP